MQPTQAVILTIDDEVLVRKSIKAYLEDYDYAVIEASDAREGLQICRQHRVDVVLLDVRMPEMNGIEVLKEIRNDKNDIPVIMLSGASNVDDVVTALRLGAQDYLTKPIIDMSILKHAVEKAINHVQLRRENELYKDQLESHVEEKTEKLEVLNCRLRLVVESASKFFGFSGLEESGSMLLEEFARHMDASGGSFYKVTNDSLELVACLDDTTPPEKLPFPLRYTSVFAYVLDTKEAIVVEDIATEKHMQPCGGTGYVNTSFAVFPIVDRTKEVLGLIALHNKKDEPFVPLDREIGAVLASCVSEVLQTASAMKALKRSEELMLQAQKREAIATLAGGIAYDFNNILSAIVGYADLGLFNKSCNEEIRGNLKQIQKAGQRARELVRQILALSRSEPVKESPVELAHTVLEALDFVRATIPSSISINQNVPQGLGNVIADPNRMHQVVMNLCTNAAHAMRETGGVLEVIYEKVALASEPFNVYEIRDDYCLRLTIRDTGVGMVEDVVNKIFEPYFTTKGKEDGTGLGLAVVQGIIGSFGGAVRLESVPHRGSSFYIYLPVAVSGNNGDQDLLETTLIPGDERILFVDDEATLAEMAEQMLNHLGYKATVYTDSVEALEHFRANPMAYDLIITDLTMPQLSGVDLSRKLLKIRSDIPIILHTGYSTMVDASEAREAGVSSFMIKPLSMTKVSHQIRDVIEGKS